MIYFKAQELDHKPFVQWNSVALSFKELQNLGLEGDSLIMAENDIPNFMFGVCPLKIIEGQLVARTDQEMDEFEAVFNTPLPENIQKEVEVLVLKIAAFKKLGENATLLEKKLNDLRIQYQFIKNKEQVTPLNF